MTPRQLLLAVTLPLWSTGIVLSPELVQAETPLKRAVVQSLRNQVRLLPKNQAPRSARRSDTLTPGDALSTARRSLAELRFNDNSLARIGELALFRFVPSTRSFRLDNGTVLLLIPPGQGRTRVRTPNAVAGIRGSALFVRYNSTTNTTIVGALTNSQIEVFNGDESQRQELKAGQLVVVVQNRIEQIYNFDLKTFYDTSELVKGLDLPGNQPTPSADPAIAQVQQETAEAVRSQTPVQGQGVIENPGFIGLNSLPAASPSGILAPASINQSPGIEFSPVLTGRPTGAAPNPGNPDAGPGSATSGGGSIQQGQVGQPDSDPRQSGASTGQNDANSGQSGNPGGANSGNAGAGGNPNAGAGGNPNAGAGGNPNAGAGGDPNAGAGGNSTQQGPPGQTGQNPGQSQQGPPGQTGQNPGQSGAPPPGQSGANPGRDGSPGNGRGGGNQTDGNRGGNSNR